MPSKTIEILSVAFLFLSLLLSCESPSETPTELPEDHTIRREISGSFSKNSSSVDKVIGIVTGEKSDDPDTIELGWNTDLDT